ncbi:hypothetical protein BGX23_005996 [Mortierella sp. AD031]|nr:hypothetical protein BGX23_005996 [Mortierella sp. AD031]
MILFLIEGAQARSTSVTSSLSTPHVVQLPKNSDAAKGHLNMKKSSYTSSPPPSIRSGNGHDDDEKSVSSQRERKRDNLGKKAGHTRTASSQGSAEAEHAVSVTAMKSPDLTPLSSTLPIKPRLDVYLKNVASPVVNVSLPKFGARIDNTPQLALCARLLPKDPDTLDESNESSQDTLTETDRFDWLKAIKQDPVEQDHIRWLANRMVDEFAKDATKDSVALAEAVLLGPALEREYYRKLLACVLKEFDESRILDANLLQGLVQLVQSASEGFLVADDLVKILDILRRHLEGTHQQSIDHPFHLTLAVSRILDVMADHKVQDLDRVVQHEPLSAVLSILKSNPDPYLLFQASYAFQALQYVPDNETALQAVIRHSGGVADSLIKISGVLKLDLSSALEGLRGLQGAVSSTYEIAGSVYDGVRSLMESGRGVLDSLREGFGSGHKRPWYPALRVAHASVYTGQLADLNKLICKAPCRRDPLFQWGICQLLGEIATDSIWDIATRQHAIDLLGALFKDDDEWGQDESVKTWMLNIFGQLGRAPEHAVKVSALLQNLNVDQDTISSLPYPLRSHLPMPASSPTLAKVQDIPYVEYDLHQYQVLRLKQSHQTVYIPPSAKPDLTAKDSDIFPLMEKVDQFLAGNREVMLILGDSGSGKSTFNRYLEHRLWTAYKQGGPIPLFINLPSIDQPDKDLIGKSLKLYDFNDDQIKELKQHRRLIIICDGYDESQLLVNLHKTNLLNQPGQWNTKMVITCRTQFLGPNYKDRFQPMLSDRYTSGPQELFQEVVIAPFSKDQVKKYVEQYAQDPQTALLFKDRTAWSSSEYMDKLAEIPNLMDLVRNPFLLTLSLKALPALVESDNDLSNIRITRVGLYDKFIDQWLEMSKHRLQCSTMSRDEQETLRDLVEDNFVACGIKYLTRLATSIFKEQDGTPIVQYSHREDKASWKAVYFGTEPEAKLLRESSPLIRAGHQYRFVHRSVLEYLLSQAIYGLPKINAERGLPGDSGPILVQLPDSECPLFQRNLLKESSVIQFLCDRVHQNPGFEQRLRSVVEQSKTDASAATAATNAITILVKAGEQIFLEAISNLFSSKEPI